MIIDNFRNTSTLKCEKPEQLYNVYTFCMTQFNELPEFRAYQCHIVNTESCFSGNSTKLKCTYTSSRNMVHLAQTIEHLVFMVLDFLGVHALQILDVHVLLWELSLKMECNGDCHQ